MKKMIFALFLFPLIASAEVCPVIEGSYECISGSRVSMKEFQHTNNGYIIVSDGVEQTLIVDNQYREVPETDSYKDAKFKARCEKSNLVVDFNASILYEGSVIAKQSTVVNYIMKNDVLTIIQKTKMKGIPLPTLNFKCTKIDNSL